MRAVAVLVQIQPPQPVDWGVGNKRTQRTNSLAKYGLKKLRSEAAAVMAVKSSARNTQVRLLVSSIIGLWLIRVGEEEFDSLNCQVRFLAVQAQNLLIFSCSSAVRASAL